MIRIIKKILLCVVAMFGMLMAYAFFAPRRTICKVLPEKITLSTIKRGRFVQYIPQTGIIAHDSTSFDSLKIDCPIDELYLDKIGVGQKATTEIDGITWNMIISHVYPRIVNGRFNVEMKFNEGIPPNISIAKSIRIKIELSIPTNALLLPMGGFYKVTGGRWIFVMDGRDRFVRKNIYLGRKAGSEYFEVLWGLKDGDVVITSTYENFEGRQSLDLFDLKKAESINLLRNRWTLFQSFF